MVDAYARRPDERLGLRIRAHLAGVLHRGGGTLRNDFFDDMGWLALALLHLGEVRPVTRSRTDELVRGLIAEIRTGSSDLCGGGIAWARPHPDFKNVPATATGAIAAIRCGAAAGDASLVAWGASLVEWMHATLVAEGVVWDGTHSRGDGRCEVERAEYTYTYGLVIGADVALHSVSGDRDLLARARGTAAIALARMTDPTTGLWRGEGSADGGLFRGILARFLGELAMVTADTGLAAEVRRNGAAAWAARDGADLVGGDWTGPRSGPVTLSEHLGAALLLEQCARLG